MRLRGVVAAIAALLVLPWAPPTVAAPAAARRDIIILLDAHLLWISPNGDGRQDGADLGFRLYLPAQVTVTARGGGRVLTEELGRLDVGRHRWHWDGRIDGRIVPDGKYVVRVTARRGPRAYDRGRARVIVDTTADRGRFVTSRRTVYPRARAVDDSFLVQYLRAGWDPVRIANQSYGPMVAHFSVRAPDGDVVVTDRVRDRATLPFAWDGRTAEGRAVPEGRYVVRVRVRDPAGNVRDKDVPVVVSHAQLEQATYTRTTAGGETAQWFRSFGSCLGCGEYCIPYRTDARFPLGVGVGCVGVSTVGYFSADVPFAPAPVDTFRVTVTGGPHVEGSPATARLQGGVQLGPGDGSATGPWTSVELQDQPHLPSGHAPAGWEVFADPDNFFDIATFTVEYRHWVPVS